MPDAYRDRRIEDQGIQQNWVKPAAYETFAFNQGSGVFLPTSAFGDKSVRFGGDGSDGPLDTRGGTVDIDLGGADIVVKNYTYLYVATNNLTFSNPGTNGTLILLLVRNDVTISATIDASGMGASGGAGGAGSGSGDGNPGTAGSSALNSIGSKVGGGGGGGAGLAAPSHGAGGTASTGALFLESTQPKTIRLTCGSGGGGGGSGRGNSGNGGAGGAGGPGFYIECGRDFNFSGTINVSGDAGSAGSSTDNESGGGGGGAGGTSVILYNKLFANTGTVTVSGGAGGAGGDGSSGSPAKGGGGAGGSNNSSASDGDAGDANAAGDGSAGANGTSTIEQNIIFA